MNHASIPQFSNVRWNAQTLFTTYSRLVILKLRFLDQQQQQHLWGTSQKILRPHTLDLQIRSPGYEAQCCLMRPRRQRRLLKHTKPHSPEARGCYEPKTMADTEFSLNGWPENNQTGERFVILFAGVPAHPFQVFRAHHL